MRAAAEDDTLRAAQGSVRAIWEAQNLPRAQAAANALKCLQVGKPITAELKPTRTRSGEWTLW
jgi:hypothetical protein